MDHFLICACCVLAALWRRRFRGARPGARARRAAFYGVAVTSRAFLPAAPISMPTCPHPSTALTHQHGLGASPQRWKGFALLLQLDTLHLQDLVGQGRGDTDGLPSPPFPPLGDSTICICCCCCACHAPISFQAPSPLLSSMPFPTACGLPLPASC